MNFLLATFVAVLVCVSSQDLSTKIFFSKGWNADRVDFEESEGKGNWTSFMDADRPFGMGEFEDVWRERIHFKGDCRALWCVKPVAMEIGLSLRLFKYKPNATIDDAWRCTNLPDYMDPIDGFVCLARDQKIRKTNPMKESICYREICEVNGLKKDCRRCFDARVRYFCQKEHMECQENMYFGNLE